MALKPLCVANVGVPPQRDACQTKRLLTPKLLLIMKLTAIILLSACLTASAKGHTQNVTLSLKDAPLEKVFSAIEKQTGYYFTYTRELLQHTRPIDLDVKDLSLTEVLAICLKDQPVSYEIIDKAIIIKQFIATVIASDEGAKQPALIDIKGRITNEDGEPVAASVIIKGTAQGTTTNVDGYFEIKGVDENATLLITGISIETREVSIAKNPGLKSGDGITLIAKTKVTSLNEVIVNKGYYTEKQKYSVGNVGHVSAKDIERQPINNPLLALQGRVPGLFITQNSGITGGTVVTRVQGRNSIASGNEPLVIVDGVPYPTQLQGTAMDVMFGGGGGSPLAFINPSDIESMDILKDADATAIYGSRAANGAILITTKKGKVGRMRMNLNLQQGLSKLTRKKDLLNRRQYLDMRYEAFKNDGVDWTDPSESANDLKVWDTTRVTDWQDYFIGNTAHFTDLNLSVGGGSSNIQYLIGGTWHRESTVFPGNFNDTRASLHFNVNSTSTNQRFKMQLSGSYMNDNNKLPSDDLTGMAITMEPVAPNIYNDEGILNWAPDGNGTSTWENPLAIYTVKDFTNKTTNLIANSTMIFRVLQGLELKSVLGYTKLQSNQYVPNPLEVYRPEDRALSNRSSSFGIRNSFGWSIEPQICYTGNVSKGKLEVLLGASVQQSGTDFQTIVGTGYSNDLLMKNISSATSVIVSGSASSIYKYNGGFGRLNYNWAQKYILNLTARRDGSSRFGPENRFHNFFGVGAGWIFTEEKVVKNNLGFLSFGKLKASYGSTGNDQIGDYSYLNSYFPVFAQIPYQGSSGLASNTLYNPFLQWEETRKLQLGIELGMWDNRVLLNGTYQRNRSSNQLLAYSLPSITGVTNISQNFPATVENVSWEFSVNMSNLNKKNFKWSTNLNLTIPRNKLIDFPNLATSSYRNVLLIGQPIGIQKTYRYLGVDPNTGSYQAADKEGKPTSSPIFPDDYTILINTLPKFYGGIQNSLTYKSFQLEFLFQYVKQIGSNNFYFSNSSIATPGSFYPGSSNQPKSVLDRWQNSGDIKTIQKYSSYLLNTENVGEAGFADASFIRLKSISLLWQVPFKWVQKMRLQSCSFYIEGRNLITITPYKGIDPENQSYQSLPPLTVLTGGVKIEL